MTLYDCLRSRRSIRKFAAAPVARETVEELLAAAILAPSASNRQPWQFLVVDDAALLRKIWAFSPGITGEPPGLLFLCLDESRLPLTDGKPDGSTAQLDLAMAAENLMLAAVEKGLGTCVIKSFHPQLISRILSLPSHIRPELLVTLGYPAQTPPMPPRRPLDTLVHYNRWEV